MKRNIFKDKSFQFAIVIVNLYKYLVGVKKEYVLSKQLLRCGTSIGALHREAEHAERKADFIHNMAIAQKESNESIYWLELLKATDYIDEEEFRDMEFKAVELMKLATAIIKPQNKKKLTTEH